MKTDVQALIQKYIPLRSSNDLIINDPLASECRQFLQSTIQYARGALIALYCVDAITAEQHDDISSYFEDIYKQAYDCIAVAA